MQGWACQCALQTERSDTHRATGEAGIEHMSRFTWREDGQGTEKPPPLLTVILSRLRDRKCSNSVSVLLPVTMRQVDKLLK